MKRAVIAVLLMSLAAVAQAAALGSLDRFFNKVNTVSAKFDQVVLDEAMNTIQSSSGSLWIERPGKFRWVYDLPFEQHIVGDGKQIWVYDAELKQVAVRGMVGALGNTPALLLAGRGKLADSFTLKDLGTQGKLEWVQMIPKRNDGGFEDIRIGFEAGKIRTLEMIDGFGNTTRVMLRELNENLKIDAKRFEFTPPAGVDVIQE